MNIIKLINKGTSIFFTFLVKIKVKSYKLPLKINNLSFVSRTTVLGKNVNFNGMHISGCGLVTIGDNFHSGKDCLMISQNHNFNNGNKIHMTAHISAKILR